MMEWPSAPTPPNPIAVAGAQTGTNVSTGVANAFLNNVNQSTPTGSLTYNPTGSYSWKDPSTGHTYNIPTFTATQSLTPAQQNIFNANQATQLTLAQAGDAQSKKLKALLANNINLSGAPAGGTASMLSGIPKATTTFGDAGAITRSYGPADDFSSDRKRVEEALYGRLNPQLERERTNIEGRLADQGIRYGSGAYTGAMDDYSRQANDLRLGVTQTAGAEQQRMMDMAAQRAGFQNAAQQQAFSQAQARGTFMNAGLAQQMMQGQSVFNAANAARNQWLQERYQQRNQPINEVTALMSGSQLQNPNWLNTPSSQIANTDYAGIVQSNFQNQFANYQQESQNTNALLGGLFGVAGNAARGYFGSDERIKEDITPLGSVFSANDGGERERLPVYQYSYKGDPQHRRHVGPMAQDVERQDPKAVREFGGVKHVDARRLMGNILRAQ
jgi:hypothetical protein